MKGGERGMGGQLIVLLVVAHPGWGRNGKRGVQLVLVNALETAAEEFNLAEISGQIPTSASASAHRKVRNIPMLRSTVTKTQKGDGWGFRP
jgi:hypothetical protein